MRALGVAVARAELGTSLVAGEAAHPAVSVHLDEVERAVEAAGELGHVDVESELLVLELEHLVLGIGRVHEVHARADVRRVRAVGDELERERVPARRNAVGAFRMPSPLAELVRRRRREGRFGRNAPE